jgi:SAM-dependent methyltransferase
MSKNTSTHAPSAAHSGSPGKAAVDASKMIKINEEQAKFYDSISVEDDKKETTGYATHDKANLLTKVWASLRYRQQEAFSESGLEEKKKEFHDRWIAKKAGGAVLELGCFRGTRSSWPLIEASGQYVGIDLSANAIGVLNRKIADAGLSHKAKGVAVDFLVMEETTKYDLIFAHGVLHHFENPEPLFEKISKIIKDDGILLLTEPSQVNVAYRLIRSAYRPFQSDSAWEWPFTKNTVAAMESHFKPVDGFGWGLYSLPISVFNSVPLISKITKPLYIRTLKKEVDAGWTSNVWSNSTITAAYVKKS